MLIKWLVLDNANSSRDFANSIGSVFLSGFQKYHVCQRACVEKTSLTHLIFWYSIWFTMKGLSGNFLWISILILKSIQHFVPGIVSKGIIIIIQISQPTKANIQK